MSDVMVYCVACGRPKDHSVHYLPVDHSRSHVYQPACSRHQWVRVQRDRGHGLAAVDECNRCGTIRGERRR